MGKSKKDKKNRKGDDFEDDVADEIAALSLENKEQNDEGTASEVAKPTKKEKKKKSKKRMDSDEDDEEDEDFVMVPQPAKKGPKKPSGMSAFQMLDMMDDETGPSEEEEEVKPKESKQAKKKAPSPVDDEEDEESPAPTRAQQKKGKKDKKKQAKPEDDDIDAILAAIEEPTAKGKKGKKGEKGKQEEAEPEPSKEEGEGAEKAEEEEGSKKKKEKKREVVDLSEVKEAETVTEIGEDEFEDRRKKKKGKKGKQEEGKKDEDEELDVDVDGAENENENEKGKKKKEKKREVVDLSELQEAEMVTEIGEDEFEDRKKKKKGKKGKQPEVKKDEEEEMDVDVDGADEDEDEDDEEGGVKTKAQKKKEKRERQKKQKLEEKLKPKGKGKKKEEDKDTKKEGTPEEEKTAEAESESAVPKDEGAKGSDDEAEESKSSKKKKERDRKKKKEKKEEEEKDKKKKPANKQIKAMQEALARVKEEEERLRIEEEERDRKIEEARLAREEKARLDAEKKEKLKQKKKDKEARLKAEGKFMTKKQKEDRQRAMQMLEQMKAQGIEIPTKAEGEEPKRKRVVYEHKKKRKPGQKEGSPSEETTPAQTPVETEAKPVPAVETPAETPKEEAPAASWEEVDEPKDDWAASDEEKEADKKSEEKEDDADADEDEDEEEDEEEEGEESDEESEEESKSQSVSESESESEESDDGLSPAEKAREKALKRMQKRKEENEKKRTTDVLRAPVVCVLGHVDTGKTKILDKLRRTNVQDGEAGGITQQIGATNVPRDAIRDQTKMCKEFSKVELKLPGLLIIDTPGHESFSNLRSRGSSLCDIAVLVVDIMHGLEPQTIESINLLKKRKTPFIVALNKIDRLYQWKTNPHTDIQNTLKKQAKHTRDEFEERLKNIVVEFAQQELNVTLFHENKNPREWISMVPTSAHSGDGMGNLMGLLCELTQTMLAKRLSYTDELQATVMEVKALPGLGTTIDVILVNGTLRESDTVILAGQEGPIVTQIRGLLVPPPMKELRVKNQYEKVKELKAAQGVKLIAKDLEKALAGLPMYVACHSDEVDIYRNDIAQQLKNILNAIRLTDKGVFVQASTLGSLEALLEFLRTSKIPYAGINVGPVHKRDVMKASAMVERDIQYAVILAFDVKVERDAQDLADSVGVQIFTADIIYHLFDRFMAYREAFKKKKQDEYKNIAVFPCKLRILPQYIFNSRDPIVVGVSVEAGFIRVGTPLCVPAKDDREEVILGRITSIENNHKEADEARRGSEVCIKIEASPGHTPKMYGRHFDHTDFLISKISRESIDAVKDYFREDMQKTDWQLIVQLKKFFNIL